VLGDVPAAMDSSHLNTSPKKTKCKQTASQMLTLLRNIVFIFLPTVVQLNQLHHPKWKSLCCFCTYFHELMGTSFTLSELQTIERKQWRYLSVFIEAYGKEMVVPKFHFAGHMPFETWRYGPFRLLWCMRFEAKHQWFKRLCNRTSWKNIMFTMAEQHQKWIAFKMSMFGKADASTAPLVLTRRTNAKILVDSPMHKLFGKWIHLVGCTVAPSVYDVIWIEKMRFLGNTYKANASYCMAQSPKGTIIYGFIKGIIQVCAPALWVLAILPLRVLEVEGFSPSHRAVNKDHKFAAGRAQYLCLQSLQAFQQVNLITMDDSGLQHVVHM